MALTKNLFLFFPALKLRQKKFFFSPLFLVNGWESINETIVQGLRKVRESVMRSSLYRGEGKAWLERNTVKRTEWRRKNTH